MALLCFPVSYSPGCVVGWLGLLGSNPLQTSLVGLVPLDACTLWPEACGEDGWRTAPRFFTGADVRVVVVEGAVDMLVFTIGMLGVSLLAATVTCTRLARATGPAQLSVWTLFTTLLLLLGCSELWSRTLAIVATP